MLYKKSLIAVILACAFALASFNLARAWPDLPPAKAFISGPGIEDQIQITDPNVLQVLRLGVLEDFEHGTLAKPNALNDGFNIIRYFDGGEFRFADLTYYPNTTGARSVVYFRDGPMLQGDHTPYNEKYLYTTTNGDQILQNYLRQLGVSLPPSANANMDPNAPPAPALSNQIKPAPRTAQNQNAVADLGIASPTWLIAILAAGIGIIGIAAALRMQNRKQ